MPASSTLFGDAEAAACDIIRANTRVRTFDGVTVATDLVGFTSPARRVRVTRTGGLPVLWMRLDNAVVEFEVLAESKAVAYDLSAAARAAVFAARGRYFGNGLALYDVLDDPGGGLVFSPDPKDPAVCRYLFKLILVTQPSGVVIPIGSGPGIPPPVDDATPESFVFHQGTPATIWNIIHELGFNPAGITVIDDDGYLRDGFGIQYTVAGQILRLSFDISLAGVAYLS